MSVTIPRAQIDAVMEHHGASWPSPGDSSPDVVRSAVDVIRREAADIFSTKFEEVLRRTKLTRLADELDALADRIEAQAAEAMWSHTSGVTP